MSCVLIFEQRKNGLLLTILVCFRFQHKDFQFILFSLIPLDSSMLGALLSKGWSMWQWILWWKVLLQERGTKQWMRWCSRNGNTSRLCNSAYVVQNWTNGPFWISDIIVAAKNLALLRPTTQSSGSSKYAVDGNTNYLVHGLSCSHTNAQTNPFWQVWRLNFLQTIWVATFHFVGFIGQQLSID